MKVRIEVYCEGSLRDEITALDNSLAAMEELRGQVQVVEQPPEADSLGPVPEFLLVVLTPGTAIVLASAIVSWIRYRTRDIKIRITKDGNSSSIELTADRVRLLDQAEVGALIERARRVLEQEYPQDGEDTPAELR